MLRRLQRKIAVLALWIHGEGTDLFTRKERQPILVNPLDTVVIKRMIHHGSKTILPQRINKVVGEIWRDIGELG